MINQFNFEKIYLRKLSLRSSIISLTIILLFLISASDAQSEDELDKMVREALAPRATSAQDAQDDDTDADEGVDLAVPPAHLKDRTGGSIIDAMPSTGYKAPPRTANETIDFSKVEAVSSFYFMYRLAKNCHQLGYSFNADDVSKLSGAAGKISEQLFINESEKNAGWAKAQVTEDSIPERNSEQFCAISKLQFAPIFIGLTPDPSDPNPF